MIHSISLSFQLTAYGPGHPCPTVQVPSVAVMDLQGEEEDYGGSDGWGFAS